MNEIVLSIIFFGGLFAINPLSDGMSEKATMILTIVYMVAFAVIAGLLARL